MHTSPVATAMLIRTIALNFSINLKNPSAIEIHALKTLVAASSLKTPTHLSYTWNENNSIKANTFYTRTDTLRFLQAIGHLDYTHTDISKLL